MKETEQAVNLADGDAIYEFPQDYCTKQEGVEYGMVETASYYSTTVGKERRVTIALPPGYGAGKKYPVLYLCHGLGQDDRQWIDDGHADIILGNLLAAGGCEEMMLVMPNCRARENDAENPPDAFSLDNYRAFDNFLYDFQDDLKPFIESRYPVLTGRENTAVAGFSMGGREALYLGLKMQDTFGYIAACCPAPGVLEYEFHDVHEAGLFTEETLAVEEPYRGKTKILIAAGKEDNVVGVYPETYHRILEKNGVAHSWYKLSGGHDFQVVGKAYYNFLKELFH